MTELEIRTLVRDAIARHGMNRGPAGSSGDPAGPRAVPPVHHASHAMFVLSTGADEGGPCVIEPAVPCSHCGYCKSYGH